MRTSLENKATNQNPIKPGIEAITYCMRLMMARVPFKYALNTHVFLCVIVMLLDHVLKYELEHNLSIICSRIGVSRQTLYRRLKMEGILEYSNILDNDVDDIIRH